MSSKIRTVLIVDDDSDVRRMVRYILEAQGYAVVEATTAQEGIAGVEKHVPHLIILDLALSSESDGFWFLERKQFNPLLNKIPVLVLSGFKDSASVYKSISLGANSYLIKPFTTTSLLQKVKKTMIERESDFLTFKFEKPIQASALVRASVLRLSEEQIQIEAPIKFISSDPVRVENSLLKEIGYTSKLFKVVADQTVSIQSGLYHIKLRFVGLKDETVHKISQKVRFWK